MFALIPYETFPKITIGPIELRTFGLMVGLGVLIGAWFAARYVEQHTQISRDDTYRLATWLVVAGVIGARITWDITHWDQIESPIDLIAVWNGGLQFSGGFIAAVLVGFPTFRRWTRTVRWNNLDGFAYGLTIGLALGRVGCISVGEHFGSHSNWLLAVDFRGGTTREPAAIGDHFHNTAIYELLFLLALFGIMTLLIRRRPAPATIIGLFCVYYGVARGLSDFLRVNDKTVVGLTGAQWMCVLLIPTGVWILTRVRRAVARDAAAVEPVLDGEDESATQLPVQEQL
ncbi:MAG TPA: prolipoprotein diacylglyceryl transferase family protein [Acidimicrobiales bacterium]|nr:prolipoprotein diacylglyceryl transferase family protein [Acidimicrobiales bacterium]